MWKLTSLDRLGDTGCVHVVQLEDPSGAAGAEVDLPSLLLDSRVGGEPHPGLHLRATVL
jgi:hypothetical protein